MHMKIDCIICTKNIIYLNKKNEICQTNMKSKLFFLTIFFLIGLSLNAESAMDDFFRSTGKINTVLGVVLILFFVLIIYLVRLDKKISKIEKRIKDE